MPSRNMDCGALKDAEAPFASVEPAVVEPANVVTAIEFARSMERTWLFCQSDTKRWPEVSRARLKGNLKMAERPLPAPKPAEPVPAMVVVAPYVAPAFISILRIRWFVVSAT